MSWQVLILFAPLVAMLAVAAAVDLRSRRIPNGLTLVIVLTGLMQSVTPYATARPHMALAGILTGGALTLALFAIGAVGGGDVKLMAAAGAWVGPVLIFEIFLARAVIGMFVVLGHAIATGRLRLLMRNTAMVTVNLVHIRELGPDHVAATGEACRTCERPLPYAVPVLFATVMLLLWQGRIG